LERAPRRPQVHRSLRRKNCAGHLLAAAPPSAEPRKMPRLCSTFVRSNPNGRHRLGRNPYHVLMSTRPHGLGPLTAARARTRALATGNSLPHARRTPRRSAAAALLRGCAPPCRVFITGCQPLALPRALRAQPFPPRTFAARAAVKRGKYGPAPLRCVALPLDAHCVSYGGLLRPHCLKTYVAPACAFWPSFICSSSHPFPQERPYPQYP
jgi:hypothetical protein